jgi:hypothetical protein
MKSSALVLLALGAWGQGAATLAWAAEAKPDLSDNVAKWEGDTLVVDAASLDARMMLDDALPHREALHVFGE